MPTKSRRCYERKPVRISRALAEAVTWRSILGPAWRIDLRAYGPCARQTAKRLGMMLVGTIAYLGESTPDRAEKILKQYEAKAKGTK